MLEHVVLSSYRNLLKNGNTSLRLILTQYIRDEELPRILCKRRGIGSLRKVHTGLTACHASDNDRTVALLLLSAQGVYEGVGLTTKESTLTILDPFDELPFTPVSPLKVGRGAEGQVIGVHYHGRVFACKSVHVPEHDPQWVGEFDILSSIKHPHLVYCQRAYKRMFNLFMLVEPFCDTSFEILFSQAVSDLPIGEITIKDFLLETMGCLSSALTYLHRNRISHQNIKGANILLKFGDHAPRVYISDFGLSHRFTVSGSSGDRGFFRHTRFYCSPEQHTQIDKATNEYLPKVRRSTDIYSIGIFFLELAIWTFPPPVEEWRLLHPRTILQQHEVFGVDGPCTRSDDYIKSILRCLLRNGRPRDGDGGVVRSFPQLLALMMRTNPDRRISSDCLWYIVSEKMGAGRHCGWPMSDKRSLVANSGTPFLRDDTQSQRLTDGLHKLMKMKEAE